MLEEGSGLLKLPIGSSSNLNRELSSLKSFLPNDDLFTPNVLKGFREFLGEFMSIKEPIDTFQNYLGTGLYNFE